MNRLVITWRLPLLVVAAALVLAHPADAVTVSGKVLDDQTGESIPGVAVQIKGTSRGIAANVEGFFSLADIEPGDVTLTFTAMGYLRLEKPMTLTTGLDEHIIVRMEPSAIQFKPVEIEAERRGREERTYTPKVALINIETKELAALPQLV